MLETSYRPNGWLGIMLGSRLYYEFTEAALGNAAEWERVADSVSQEVRRHGAPPPSSQAAASARPQEAVGVAASSPVPALTVSTRKAPPAAGSPPMREVAAGVGVSSVVHNNNTMNYFNNSNTSHVSNIGNTSIVLA